MVDMIHYPIWDITNQKGKDLMVLVIGTIHEEVDGVGFWNWDLGGIEECCPGKWHY